MSFYLIAILAFRVKEMSWGNFRLGQISHTIFWATQGLGEGCVKI